jgi:xylulokinase
VIRPALLWNDTRSAEAADQLNSELGGDSATAQLVGSKLVASFTASKVRWLADHEPENAARVSAIALPHDYLSWKLQESFDIKELATDRSDASGTGYFDSVSSTYNRAVLATALRSDRTMQLPRITAPCEFMGQTKDGIPIAAGAGDNAAAALGVQAKPGDVVVSLGTSGTAFAVSRTPTHDARGEVAGFADATGNFLPLVCTLNAARILDAAATMLGISHDEVGALALSAEACAGGLTLLPYFEGERTPNRPNASGVFAGLTLRSATRENIARAMVEGMLAGLVDAVQALSNLGVDVKQILLIGGAARNPAVAPIASALFGHAVILPTPSEFVADGAARQAAWAITGGESPPEWNLGSVQEIESPATPFVVEQYRELRDRTEDWK